jgi:hypothetical protein
MIVFEDFTGLEEGTLAPGEGRVCRCPLCGRIGIRRPRHDGSVRFVHVQTTRMLSDGLSVEPADCCTLRRHLGAA